MKILLAEDDFATRKFMTNFLSKYGECDVTVDGMEAVDAFMMALEDGEPYDLVCLDIFGIPYTTQVDSSCPMVRAPAFRMASRPLAPSPPIPVRIMPSAFAPATLATESNSTSTDGQCPFTLGLWSRSSSISP